MSDDSKDNEERSPSFTKALMGRILAVGMFVVLGTFAVVHSMVGAKDTDADQAANAEILAAGVSVEAPALPKASMSLTTKPATAATNSTKPSNSFASTPFSPTGSKPKQRFGSPTTVKSKSASSAFAVNPKRPAVTAAKPATQEPPLRFAQLPGKTNPASGTSGGFAARTNSPTVKTTFGNLSNAATERTNQLTNKAVSSTNQLMNDAKKKIQSEAGDAADTIRGRFGNFGNQAQGNSTRSRSSNTSPPPLRGNTNRNSFANRSSSSSSSSNSRPPTASFDTSRDLKPVTTNTPKQRTFGQSSSRPNNTPDFGGSSSTPTRPVAQSRPNQSRSPSRPALSTQRPVANNNRSTNSPIRKTTQVRRAPPTTRSSRPVASNRSSSASRSRVDVARRTSDAPGDRELEGVQAPALTVEKLSPREIQVNREAEFEIVVKNVGRVTAQDVRVFDEIPAGTDFIGSVPDAKRGSQNLEWTIGALRPGQEKRIKLQLKPTRPGEIGSIAHVTFATRASMRTRVTKPILEIRHSAKPKILIGDPVVLDVIVENKGDGPAINVIVQEDVPPQLEFADGYRELEYEIGTLLPGQSKRVQLGLKAAQIGRLRNIMFASATGGLKARHEIDMEIIAPKLTTSAEGPTRRFLQRKVEHRFNIENTGTAEATNVELVARLPSGLRYLSANNQGRYDANSHAVYWSLAQMQPSIKASVEIETMPVEVGTQDIKFEALADLNQRSESKQALSVEHLVDVFFDIDDVVDPIEIGSDTRYRIRIVNQGTKTANNVQIQVDFPKGLRPTGVEGNLRNEIQGQTVVFAPISTLSPGDELSVEVSGRGTAAGDHRVAVSMRADGRETQVTKEETTRVYSDR